LKQGLTVTASAEELMNLSRRELVAGGITLAAGLITRAGWAAAKPTVTVYKSPT
jgi:ABC-type hemin transport system substrate-binding protein